MSLSLIPAAIDSWESFVNSQKNLSKKQKGDAFELLTKYYFLLHPKNQKIKEAWISNEIPIKVKKELGIGTDIGIDVLLKDEDGNYIPVQCKYHSDPKQDVGWKEASTFFGIYNSNAAYKQSYLCTSAYGISRHYSEVTTKPILRVTGFDWKNLDNDFFSSVQAFREGARFNYKPFQPREHQVKAIADAKDHFLKKGESRGKLIFPCGAGKSLTGFWFSQELDAKSVVIAVPSLSLVKQTLDVYMREIVANNKAVKWLCICSDDDIGTSAELKFETSEIGVPCTTDPNEIKEWLQENRDEQTIVFTTYQSGRLIADISKEVNMNFDLGIFDEAHKTVGSNNKLFSYLLFEKNIDIKKRIFMTATERFYAGSRDDIVSMNDEDIYGGVFSKMSFKDAIEQELLTDYKIITIDIKKSEVADFLKKNQSVELMMATNKDAESRSLASMLALRKAMKRFGIKNAVSFHSSIKKAQNAKELQGYISETYSFKSIDAYTVSGKMSTSKREIIVDEFADSRSALITNSRCLTEGVDVPNIDCIVFADPRRSKIDIVQALGRALRKKEGKNWGYVVLPVVYDGESHEIDNDNFNEILAVIRGLAANDERIIEYFTDKNSIGEKGGGQMSSEQFKFLSESLSESEFKENLTIRLWDSLSRFQWMPFEKAREFARSLNLKSVTEWGQFVKSNRRPKNIPSKPYNSYKSDGWEDFNDWLGTQIPSNWDKHDNFFSYQEAKTYIIENCGNKVSSMGTFKKWSQNEIPSLSVFPEKMPKKPWAVYSEWVDTYDFFETKRKGKKESHSYNHFKFSKISYEELKLICQKENLQTRIECQNWIRANQSIFNKNGCYAPVKGGEAYKEFEGWAKFLDTKNAISIGKSRGLERFTLEEAKEFIKKLNLKSKTEFYEYLKLATANNKVPGKLPRAPRAFYLKKGWKGWPDFLGKNKVS